MAQEENMMILRMLQDGSITAEQAAELLHAIDSPTKRTATGTTDAPSDATAPPPPPPLQSASSVPPPVSEPLLEFEGSDALARARAKIAAARERVAGVHEQLSAAEEKLENAAQTSNPWEQVADALKDVPGARSITDALRSVDAGRIAAAARRQARRVGRSIKASFDDLNIDMNLNLGEQVQGEPTLTAAREAMLGVAPGVALLIRNPLGDIEVVGADVPEARVAGTLRVWANDLAAAELVAADILIKTETSRESASVRIEGGTKVARRIAMDLKVFVPTSVRVSVISPGGDLAVSGLENGAILATQSGDAQVSNVRGSVALESASGDLLARNIRGTVQATSASGDIHIDTVQEMVMATTHSGDILLHSSLNCPSISLESASGDISVKNSSAVNTLKARSVSGDIALSGISATGAKIDIDTVSGFSSVEIQGTVSSGSIGIVAVSGDISLRLPYDSDAVLSITTKSGEIEGKLRGPSQFEDRNLRAQGMAELSETVGAGAGAKIHLTTISGDIELRQSLRPGDDIPTATATETPSAPSTGDSAAGTDSSDNGPKIEPDNAGFGEAI